jgi:tRNA threonylcarbamoyl adenosine modification protein YeaZ
MIILGIDTSSTDLSVCLNVDGSVRSTVDRYVKNSHAEHIAGAVAAVLRLSGVEAGEVTHIAVSVGPGSFTGLRIGLSFVKGFCMMTERPVLPISSLFVLAHAAAGCGLCSHSDRQPQKIFAALDARNGRVHWGGFSCDGSGGRIAIRRLASDRLSSPEELLGELSRGGLLVTDAMGYERGSVFGAFAGAARIADAGRASLRRGLSCAAIAFDNIGNSGGELTWRPASRIAPNYLQMPAAEERMALCS